MSRGSFADLDATLELCCETLDGVGVGSVEDFDRATTTALATLLLLEAAYADRSPELSPRLARTSIDPWLDRLVESERRADSIRRTMADENARRALGLATTFLGSVRS